MSKIEQAINTLDLSNGVVNSSDLSQFSEDIYEDLIWYLIEKGIDIYYDVDLESQLYFTDIDQQHIGELNLIPCLKNSDQNEIANQYHQNQDQKSRQLLIESKLHKVRKIAQLYYCNDYPNQDTDQNGYLGLVKGVNNFNDPDAKNFRKHIDHWIRQTIERETINSKSTIRIPIGQDLKLTEFKKALEALTDDLGNKPTANELALYLEITPEEVEKLFANYLIQKVASLEELTDSEDYLSLIEPTIDDPEIIIYENSYQNDIKNLIPDLLATLPERERRIIELRFGLEDGIEYTLEELMKEFKVSRSRIGQIEKRALKRLSRSSSLRKMVDYK